MKFQHTKHKAKWDRIIKHLKKGVKQYEKFRDLARVCCDDSDILNYNYACDYTYQFRFNSDCDKCPLDFDGLCPYMCINIAYNNGEFKQAISLAKIIRDLPVKKGVKVE